MAVEQETRARAEALNHSFGFMKTSAIKTAIELEIPDILQNHEAPLSLSALSSALDCPVDRLYRFMRFLAYHGIFKKTDSESSAVYYAQTPISRQLTKDNLGPFLLLQGAVQGPVASVTPDTLKRPAFGSYDHPIYTNKVFTDAMASHARSTTSAIIENYGKGFDGVGSLVDVGGSYGMALGMLVKAFPWVRGIILDLPQVVSRAPHVDGVEFVAGSMFESVPKADAVMLMFVLHNWSDKECIDILKKCKEAVPSETGKVIIVDAVIDEEGQGDEFAGARLGMDVSMMVVMSEGKERTHKEWTHIIKEAGFRRYVIKNIGTLESLIEAYP